MRIIGINGSSGKGWTLAGGAASGGGGGFTPPAGVLGALYWFDASQQLLDVPTGTPVPVMQNLIPTFATVSFLQQGGATATTVAKQAGLNSLPTLNFAVGGGEFLGITNPADGTSAGYWLAESTSFVVFKAAGTGDRNLYSGRVGGDLNLIVGGGGSPGWINGTLKLNAEGVTAIGTSSAVVNENTFYQANVTFDGATGDWAFRIAEAAAGSGNTAASITTATNLMGSSFVGEVAEMILYTRVLTAPEILEVEAYLNKKWGV
jgi:hypothetical protein